MKKEGETIEDYQKILKLLKEIELLYEERKIIEGKIIAMEEIKGTKLKVGGEVWSCHISLDATFAIIGSWHGTARLAEIKRDKEGKIIAMEEIKGTKLKVGGWVKSCQISPDATFAIIGSGNIARLAEIKRD